MCWPGRLPSASIDAIGCKRELAMLDGTARASAVDATHLEKTLRAKLKDWREMLLRQTPLTRQLLLKLLDAGG